MSTLQKCPMLNFPSWLLTVLVSVYLLIMFNQSFFSTTSHLHGIDGMKGLAFMVSLFFFLLTIINLFFTVFSIPWLTKPVLILIVVTSSAAAYFMQTYNIMIDKTMIQNMLETDLHESLELFNVNLLKYVFITGVIPSCFILLVTVDYSSTLKQILTKLSIIAISGFIIGGIAILFYQDYASLIRNHKEVRNLIVPVNYIYSIQSYAKHYMPHNDREFENIGMDSRLGPSWKASHTKKSVMVLVVGETARSTNFSLFNYDRETTPNLKKENITSFDNVYSCGTSTAISLPCMFSRMDRHDYDKTAANNSDNILDILQRSGLQVIWIDNNSGCKGVCDRVISQSVTKNQDKNLCNDRECYDMILLKQLQTSLESSEKDSVIVLHQKGSHGPAYYLRTPKEFQKFLPLCETNQLQTCSEEQIKNSYDNTILYTDYFLSKVINYLKSNNDVFDSSMLYISDHGESLGENNLYLHGLPYMIAPKEQKHVPLLVWMSDGYSDRFAINQECLQSKRRDHFTHDNLFDTILGMLDVQTTVYRKKYDIFNGCRDSSHALLVHNESE